MANSSISLKQLSGSVDTAVKAALERHKVKATNGFVINPGTLAGPLLDHATDLKVAQQIAEEVTKQVAGAQGPGALALPHVQPAVLVTSRFILCGFFPYEVPQINVDHY
jgi:hypothetical protein